MPDIQQRADVEVDVIQRRARRMQRENNFPTPVAARLKTQLRPERSAKTFRRHREQRRLETDDFIVRRQIGAVEQWGKFRRNGDGELARDALHGRIFWRKILPVSGNGEKKQGEENK
jgi:hypothetical protein